jgi:hypothetical protein
MMKAHHSVEQRAYFIPYVGNHTTLRFYSQKKPFGDTYWQPHEAHGANSIAGLCVWRFRHSTAKIPKYILPSNSPLKTYILPHKITNELWQFMDNFAIYAAGFAVIHAVKENMEFYA